MEHFPKGPSRLKRNCRYQNTLPTTAEFCEIENKTFKILAIQWQKTKAAFPLAQLHELNRSIYFSQVKLNLLQIFRSFCKIPNNVLNILCNSQRIVQAIGLHCFHRFYQDDWKMHPNYSGLAGKAFQNSENGGQKLANAWASFTAHN